MAAYQISPIGVVRNGVTGRSWQNWRGIVSEIVLESQYEQGLAGIEDFSHIILLFYLHHVELPGAQMMVHPQRRDDLPLVGVFATRAPVRPNPVGLSSVKLLERKGNLLKVLGLDAIDGTPVIDIKPYIPERFSDSEVRTPAWLNELRHR